ncbi:hypothetical protein V7S43_002733 [Phytophthora oleae]|uniref:Uncharacterized protein n=1 Tax=Phytophthora oleae TaxID=2107226 RepID=A0ABD3G2I5_9STRA
MPTLSQEGRILTKSGSALKYTRYWQLLKMRQQRIPQDGRGSGSVPNSRSAEQVNERQFGNWRGAEQMDRRQSRAKSE